MHMNAARLNVALIGYSFMGKVHAQAWQTAPRFFDLGCELQLHTAVGRSAAPLADFANRFSIPNTSQDWREVIDDPEVDALDLCVPGDMHAEIAIAALEAGKHVLCEKPLANTVAEAEAMNAAAVAARARGVHSMVGFSYRSAPAIAYAKQLVADGRLGKIRHIRANYLQDWIVDESFPLVWRLQKAKAGSGALGDIGAHIIDLAAFISGQTLTGVSALTETFVRERPLPAASEGLSASGGEGTGIVDVDDAAVFFGKTPEGALATFEATRFATGRKNAIRLEINGSLGSLAFDFERMNELFFYDHTIADVENGFRRILVTEAEHPFFDAWWPPGHGLGYEHTFTHQAVSFARAIAEGREPTPSFADGLYVQQVLDAVERSAAAASVWTPIHTE